MAKVVELGHRHIRVSIDLSKRGGLSRDSVRRLIASGDDRVRNQLCVTRRGVAFLHVGDDPVRAHALAFQLESFQPGNGYVGPAAAQDREWIERIHRCLATTDWQHLENEYIDCY
jgi:hypothetical protein